MSNFPFIPAESAEPARWITEGVQGFAQSVLSIVPAGFEAYARIFHPPRSSSHIFPGYSATPVSWAEVAAQTGRTVHRQMQWQHIMGDDPPANLASPEEGSLPLATAHVLWPLLRQYTATPEHCFFAVWEGFGCLGETVLRAPAFETPSRRWHLFHAPIEAIEQTFSSAERGTLLVRRTHPLIGAWQTLRNLVLFKPRAPVRARLGDPAAEAEEPLDFPLSYQSANFWWPADRTWCVATEIDFKTTYIGGSRTAIDNLLQSTALEAYAVEPTDGVTYASDTVNPKPLRAYT